jgi:farnesyl-diphosphate farnesyltransferase
VLQIPFKERDIQDVFRGNEDRLPEVSLRLGEWVQLAPADIAPRIWETFSSMAERMACWVERGWRIETKSDLDEYTYAVSGVLVLMLSDLWSWFDHTDSNRAYGISYGRALQATNILIDRVTDKDRGVDFWPEGWQLPQMLAYVKSEMTAATAYVAMLPRNAPARRFCEQPLLNAQQAIKELEFSGLYT